MTWAGGMADGWRKKKKSQNTKDGELGFFVVFYLNLIQAWKELVVGGCWPASTWR